MAQILHALAAVGPDRPGELVALDGNRARPRALTSHSVGVLIAHGQGLVRAGFRGLLERCEGVCVVGEAGTGEEAVATALQSRPDVVLIDIALPGMDGLEATRRIVGAAPARTRVLMLMTSASDDVVFGALRAGATGLLLEDADAGTLVNAVRVVADGDALLSPKLTQRLVADFLSRPERLRATPERLAELTAREREVVTLVACGLSNEEIAERLVVTRATAKTHVSRAMRKLRARDRAQLVVLAYETGLVRPGPDWSDSPAPVARFGRAPAGASMRRSGLGPVAA